MTINEETSICLLSDSELTLRPNEFVTFRFDFNIDFRMLEINLLDFCSSALVNFFSCEDARLHSQQVDSKNLL